MIGTGVVFFPWSLRDDKFSYISRIFEVSLQSEAEL